MARVMDVFNGDADGLCALHQLRLAQPEAAAHLVTGVKRDIGLLARVKCEAGDRVTVLDVSIDTNRAALLRILGEGARVRYFDHHFAGEPIEHEGLVANIDTSPDVCTSILVDRHLEGRFRPWAIAAAFGDNLAASARQLAAAAGLNEADIETLAELGECLNYNGYGEAIEDLHFHPAQLYREMQPYVDPLSFARESAAFVRLREGFRSDLAQADATAPLRATDCCAAYLLPDAPWARRVSGVYANRLATRSAQRAHAILSPNSSGNYVVSVRAPLANPRGADALCRQFPSGGGRSAAAGINQLPPSELEAFLEAFRRHFSPPPG